MATATVFAERFDDVAAFCPPPACGDRLVSRDRLLAPLLDPAGPPLALVTAPAGYGRTTLLADWVRRDPRTPAWIAIEPAHDENPALLGSAIAHALDRAGPLAIVLDDVHLLRSSGSRNLLRTIAGSVPSGSRLALSSRTEPPLPVGRLRGQRAIVELGERDLAMTPAEAVELLGAEDVGPVPGGVDSLLRRTEGWPVALYLAAVALRTEGTDALISRYLADSVLAELPPALARFLTRTSVADRLCAGLCDAILASDDAAPLLEELANERRLLVPLDRSGDWYRCPAPLQEMLLSELRRADPGGEADLRRRAVDWYVAHDDSERATDQAIAAGDAARAGELLWTYGPGHVFSGRGHAVDRRLTAFSDEQRGADPRLALVGAVRGFAQGDLDTVQRWEAVARRRIREDDPASPAASELAAAADTLQSVLSGEGLTAAARDAAAARAALPEDSPWRSVCAFVEGSSTYLRGDLVRAEAVLQDGARRGAVIAPGPHALCLAQLALIAADRDDWEGAAAIAGRAHASVEHHGLESDATSALVYAAAAMTRARRGRVGEAQADLRQALRLLEPLAGFAPWFAAGTRVALARAALRLGDLPAARELAERARCDAYSVPGAPVLAAGIEDVEASVEGASASGPAAHTSMTAAELRILRFLPTHLSFREIASDLFVSANTVKTQAHSVYRKLDASSRSQAVARASELGLLDI